MPVTRIEVTYRGPLSGGKEFGEAGAYEYLSGVLHFTADPKYPVHSVICDLQLAPTNAQGLVEYSAQFHLIKPVSPGRGGRLLVDSLNRGNMTALARFNDAVQRSDDTPDVDTGNGFLMRMGYSVL